jgi:hypothetical protein
VLALQRGAGTRYVMVIKALEDGGTVKGRAEEVVGGVFSETQTAIVGIGEAL